MACGKKEITNGNGFGKAPFIYSHIYSPIANKIIINNSNNCNINSNSNNNEK